MFAPQNLLCCVPGARHSTSGRLGHQSPVVLPRPRSSRQHRLPHRQHVSRHVRASRTETPRTNTEQRGEFCLSTEADINGAIERAVDVL